MRSAGRIIAAAPSNAARVHRIAVDRSNSARLPHHARSALNAPRAVLLSRTPLLRQRVHNRSRQPQRGNNKPTVPKAQPQAVAGAVAVAAVALAPARNRKARRVQSPCPDLRP